jgi:hypothetical protein
MKSEKIEYIENQVMMPEQGWDGLYCCLFEPKIDRSKVTKWKIKINELDHSCYMGIGVARKKWMEENNYIIEEYS